MAGIGVTKKLPTPTPADISVLTIYTGWARKKYTEIIVSCALTARAKLMIFCTKVIQNVAKQLPLFLMQDNVEHQAKDVLCRDIHFDQIAAGN